MTRSHKIIRILLFSVLAVLLLLPTTQAHAMNLLRLSNTAVTGDVDEVYFNTNDVSVVITNLPGGGRRGVISIKGGSLSGGQSNAINSVGQSSNDWNRAAAETNAVNSMAASSNDWNHAAAQTNAVNSMAASSNDWNHAAAQTNAVNNMAASSNDWNHAAGQTNAVNNMAASSNDWNHAAAQTNAVNNMAASTNGWNLVQIVMNATSNAWNNAVSVLASSSNLWNSAVATLNSSTNLWNAIASTVGLRSNVWDTIAATVGAKSNTWNSASAGGVTNTLSANSLFAASANVATGLVSGATVTNLHVVGTIANPNGALMIADDTSVAWFFHNSGTDFHGFNTPFGMLATNTDIPLSVMGGLGGVSEIAVGYYGGSFNDFFYFGKSGPGTNAIYAVGPDGYLRSQNIYYGWNGRNYYDTGVPNAEVTHDIEAPDVNTNNFWGDLKFWNTTPGDESVNTVYPTNVLVAILRNDTTGVHLLTAFPFDWNGHQFQTNSPQALVASNGVVFTALGGGSNSLSIDPAIVLTNGGAKIVSGTTTSAVANGSVYTLPQALTNVVNWTNPNAGTNTSTIVNGILSNAVGTHQFCEVSRLSTNYAVNSGEQYVVRYSQVDTNSSTAYFGLDLALGTITNKVAGLYSVSTSDFGTLTGPGSVFRDILTNGTLLVSAGVEGPYTGAGNPANFSSSARTIWLPANTAVSIRIMPYGNVFNLGGTPAVGGTNMTYFGLDFINP